MNVVRRPVLWFRQRLLAGEPGGPSRVDPPRLCRSGFSLQKTDKDPGETQGVASHSREHTWVNCAVKRAAHQKQETHLLFLLYWEDTTRFLSLWYNLLFSVIQVTLALCLTWAEWWLGNTWAAAVWCPSSCPTGWRTTCCSKRTTCTPKSSAGRTEGRRMYISSTES